MTELLVNNPVEPVGAHLILAHGAGAPMDSPFMNCIAEGVAERGIKVSRFEFPYMQERRETGKKRPPNTQSVLLDSWRNVIAEAGRDEPLFIGGKSMGGRMATLIAEELKPAGVVCLGYPFHALGKPEKPRIDHLKAVSLPVLILQGTRDAMGNRERVTRYTLSDLIELVWLEDGDHDLKPRVKSGLTHQHHLDTAILRIEQFIKGTL